MMTSSREKNNDNQQSYVWQLEILVKIKNFQQAKKVLRTMTF